MADPVGWDLGFGVLAHLGPWLLGFGFTTVKTRHNLVQSEIPFLFVQCCVGVCDSGFGFWDRLSSHPDRGLLGFGVSSGIWDLGSGI